MGASSGASHGKDAEWVATLQKVRLVARMCLKSWIPSTCSKIAVMISNGRRLVIQLIVLNLKHNNHDSMS